MDYHSLIYQKQIEVQEKLEKAGFPKIDLTFDIKQLQDGWAGCALMSHYLISIDYLKTNLEYVLERTVPHEISHCYVFYYFPKASKVNNGHGYEWKRFMEVLGAEQSRYHKMSLNPNKTVKYNSGYSFTKTLNDFADVIWNDIIEAYEGIIGRDVVFTNPSYNAVKRYISENYNITMFNVVMRKK